MPFVDIVYIVQMYILRALWNISYNMYLFIRYQLNVETLKKKGLTYSLTRFLEVDITPSKGSDIIPPLGFDIIPPKVSDIILILILILY